MSPLGRIKMNTVREVILLHLLCISTRKTNLKRGSEKGGFMQDIYRGEISGEDTQPSFHLSSTAVGLMLIERQRVLFFPTITKPHIGHFL